MTPAAKAATKKAPAKKPPAKKAATKKATTKKAPAKKAATRKAATRKAAAATPERVKGPASYFPSIERTYGRPIAEWKAIIRASGCTRHSDYVTMLKRDHGMGHGHATALVAHTLAEDAAAG